MNTFPMGAGRTRPFRRGFAAVLPLWLAAAPFALAYVISARQAGLSPLEIQLMSLLVFSAAAQIALVQLLSGGGSIVVILLTMLAMNLHHLLYGVSLSKQMDLSRARRLMAAFMLTDAAYGLALSPQNRGAVRFLFGAELSMFVAWNFFTAVTLWSAPALSLIPEARVGFVVPLTFLMLLLSVVKSRLDAFVAIVSAAMAIAFNLLGLGNMVLLLAGIGGPLLGLAASALREPGTEV